MTWGDFINALVYPLFSCDPDFDPASMDTARWAVDKVPLTPDMEASLVANGVGHKSLVQFEI